MRHYNEGKQRLDRAYEDFKANNQWLVEAYWEWYYKATDMHKKIMSYPEAQQVKAVIIEMIKTVSL